MTSAPHTAAPTTHEPTAARSSAPAADSTDAGGTCIDHATIDEGTATCGAGQPHPSGATAQCHDGTYSYSTTPSGTCSHHKGVAVWYY